jgi:hypothetical protein
MKRIAAPLLLLGYTGAVVAATTLIGNPWQLWTIAVLSFTFAALLVAPGRSRLVVALGAVAVLTLLLPVGVLVFMGQATYGSLSEALRTIISSSMEHGQLAGFEWFVPLISAGAGAALGSRHAL